MLNTPKLFLLRCVVGMQIKTESAVPIILIYIECTKAKGELIV